jgi:UDP-N-acetylglucosamine 1-carboxyvinyltransferase
MAKLLIEGGNRLRGKVNISGFKNAALAIIPATILTGSVCVVENLPVIQDVIVYQDILKKLGGEASLSDSGTMVIDTSKIQACNLPNGLTKKLRASYYLLGAGLGRFKEVTISYPGGCDIGLRPIDQHVKGLEALGAVFEVNDGLIKVSAEKLIGNKIYLDVVSVGATINIMMAAVFAEGKTVIENAAKEPHVVDTANFLNAMGANIRGAGTDVIRITGVQELHGGTYSVIPDQVEAGTYMIASAVTKGDLIINNIIPKHLEPVTAKLKEMGMSIEEYGDSLRVHYEKELVPVNIKTLPYPGFPTDLQQPMTVLLSTVKGESIVIESIFENRFKYIEELQKMGANIKVEGRVAAISGIEKLKSAEVKATDLRAGAALVVACLAAEGVSTVHDIYHIDRGYEFIENKFMNLGAKIRRVEDDEENSAEMIR